MNYEHRSNVNNKSLPPIIKILGVLIIILSLLYYFLPNFLPRIFAYIASPFWNLERPIEDGIDSGSVKLQNILVDQLKKENEELKTILHNTASSSVPTLAYIYKKPPFTAFDTYIIEIGNSNNIKLNDKVYTVGNVLLGEIVEINGNFAKVKLYSSYGNKFNVLIGKNNIQAIAEGKGGGFFETILPKDLNIELNDRVNAPDTSPYVFGIVRSVMVDPARAFATILFSQPINIYEQKWVLVYKNKI